MSEAWCSSVPWRHIGIPYYIFVNELEKRMWADGTIDGPASAEQMGMHKGQDESKLTFPEALNGAVNNCDEEPVVWMWACNYQLGASSFTSLREPQFSNLYAKSHDPRAGGERRQSPPWASIGLVCSRECPSKVTSILWVSILTGFKKTGLLISSFHPHILPSNPSMPT